MIVDAFWQMKMSNMRNIFGALPILFTDISIYFQKLLFKYSPVNDGKGSVNYLFISYCNDLHENLDLGSTYS